MGSIIQFFITVAVLTTTVIAQNELTNGTQDYLKITQANLLYKIKIAEIENNAFEDRFHDRLSDIELQQQQVLNETQKINQTLLPLPVLSLAWKSCIQTYDSQFVTYQSAKDKFENCNSMAQLNYYHLTFAAKSYTNSAKNYALNVLPRNVGSCQVHKNNQTKLEQCYIDNVQSAVEYVESYLDEAKLSREKSIFNLNSIILSAIQCSFKIEMSVLDAISLTSKKINDCLNGKGKRNILTYYTKA